MGYVPIGREISPEELLARLLRQQRIVRALNVVRSMIVFLLGIMLANQ
jgi:hypothetical protein